MGGRKFHRRRPTVGKCRFSMSTIRRYPKKIRIKNSENEKKKEFRLAYGDKGGGLEGGV